MESRIIREYIKGQSLKRKKNCVKERMRRIFHLDLAILASIDSVNYDSRGAYNQCGSWQRPKSKIRI